MTKVPAEKTVFETKWFRVVEKQFPKSTEPHYLIHTSDFVSVIALDKAGKLILVRQFRPAVERHTLELPSGHVDSGVTPEEAARAELLEETGYVGDHFECLGTMSPCIGRYTNKLWCYLVRDVRPGAADHAREAGVEVVLSDEGLRALATREDFCSSLSHAALFLALASGRLTI